MTEGEQEVTEGDDIIDRSLADPRLSAMGRRYVGERVILASATERRRDCLGTVLAFDTGDALVEFEDRRRLWMPRGSLRILGGLA